MCENRTIDEGEGECRFRVGLCLSKARYDQQSIVVCVGLGPTHSGRWIPRLFSGSFAVKRSFALACRLAGVC
jgi:hypothetical protein